MIFFKFIQILKMRFRVTKYFYEHAIRLTSFKLFHLPDTPAVFVCVKVPLPNNWSAFAPNCLVIILLILERWYFFFGHNSSSYHFIRDGSLLV